MDGLTTPKEALNFTELGTPSSASPFAFKLRSNRDVKVVKKHCVFYDLLIREEIRNMSSDKLSYYKELFEEQYDDIDFNLQHDKIEEFFRDNDLISDSSDLVDYFNSSNTHETLFVIPTFFDDEERLSIKSTELFAQNENSILRHYKVYKNFDSAINKRNNLDTKTMQTPKSKNTVATNNVHMYFLPCLIRKDNSQITENQYLEKLKKELYELQDFIKDDFLSKINDQGIIFKNISFFCEADGKLSLKFYKQTLSQKNDKFVNKFLFKELAKLKGNIQEGKQKFVDTDKVEQPLIFKKNKKQINDQYRRDPQKKFLVFLIQKILTEEILSKSKNFEILDTAGIQKLNIVFSAKIKRDLNDFYMRCNQPFRFTEKKFKEFHFDFKLHDHECQYVEKFKKGSNVFQKYWKINVIGNTTLPFQYSGEEEELYMRITADNVLKHASIYTKNRNLYEEKMKGVIQLSPKQESFREFKISNVSRSLETRNIYYYENFHFTMESFKKYMKNNKASNTNNRDGKIPRETLRKSFIETFSSKNLLNEYFLFCMNDPKLKHQIDFNFHKVSTSEKDKDVMREKIISAIVKELFKKGSKFYINQNQNQERVYSSAPGDKTYNKYMIKSIKQDNVVVQLTTERQKVIIEEMNKHKRRIMNVTN